MPSKKGRGEHRAYERLGAVAGSAEYVGFDCEEVVIPSAKTLDLMPERKKGGNRPLGAQRNILVRCPTRGLKYFLRLGHHVTVRLEKCGDGI